MATDEHTGDLFADPPQYRHPSPAAVRGIVQAQTNAERTVDPGWARNALRYVLEFAALGKPFTAPDVRKYAEAAGLEAPPNERAWGGPFLAASNRNFIVKTGRPRYADNEMHGQPIQEWIGVSPTPPVGQESGGMVPSTKGGQEQQDGETYDCEA